MPPEQPADAVVAMTGARAEDATVVVATRTEERAVRRAAPQFRVHRAGVSLRQWNHAIATPVVISAGLAGGLDSGTPTGTVVVASHVALADGERVVCDPVWIDALVSAARKLGLPVITGGIVTAKSLVTGAAREQWARSGYLAADMESGLLIGRAPRVAALRVLLDTPNRELSPRWEHPLRASLDPRRWPEAVWLFRTAPALALRAARVLAAAVADATPQK